MRTTKIHNRHTKNGPAPVRGVRQAAKVRILGRLRPEKPEHTGAAPRVWTVRTLKRPKAPADRKHRPGQILVGTASWTDPGFIADWYPAKLPPKERLGWYAQHFNLVEVNSSFYAVPAPEMTTRWCEQTPAGFVFDIKLHRLLSRHSTEARSTPDTPSTSE